ncbi:MAG: NosD domain-containing protein [Candidatus Aenigmarchaeota archaeon]|nr:NosD domain-containing protein [Candidatus Aenigmarchaeota archaeon]
MKMPYVLIILIFVIILSSTSYSYNITANGLYCGSCSDCTDAINNVTTNVTYLNASISTTSTCINSPSSFNNEIFDCQGYTIDGDDSGVSDRGILINTKNNVTVRNCIITDFYEGLRISSSSYNNTLYNNTVTSNTRGIYLYTSSKYNNVTNNTVNANTVYGIYIAGASNNTFINNSIVSNTNYGLYMTPAYDSTGSDNNTFFTNNFSDNIYNFLAESLGTHYHNIIDSSNIIDTNYNIYYNYSIENIVFNTTTAPNAGLVICANCSGVTVKDLNLSSDNYYNFMLIKTNNSIIDNITSNSNYYGILVNSSYNNTIKNSVANSNTNYGAYLYASHNNTFYNNTFSTNIEGIHIEESTNNSIYNNTMSSNTNYGAYLSLANNNTLNNNTLNTNIVALYLLDSSNNTLSNNSGLSNTGYGIYITNFTAIGSYNDILYNSFNFTNGLYVQTSDNTLIGNNFNFGSAGIIISYANNNSFTNNTVGSKTTYAFSFSSGINNVLINNSFSNNTQTFNIDTTDYFQNFYNTIDNTNTIDSTDRVYCNYSMSDYTFNTSSVENVKMFICINCTDIVVKDFNLSMYNSYSLILSKTNNTLIQNVTISSDSDYGFYVAHSTNITMKNNTFEPVVNSGIYLVFSNNSSIINNTINLNDYVNSQGIVFGGSSNNTIDNNSITYKFRGIQLGLGGTGGSENNTINNNYLNSLGYGGIFIASSNNNTISNNTINNNTFGESDSFGISLVGSNGTIVANNTLTLNDRGIYIAESDNSKVLNNIINTSDEYGIYIMLTSNSNISGNSMNDNNYSILMEFNETGSYGLDQQYFNHIIDTTNTIDNKITYYYRNQQDANLNPTNPGFMGCFNCSNVTFRDFSISGSGQGIIFASTNNSYATNVTVGNNYIGFFLDASSENNTISDSFIYNNPYRTIIDLGTGNTFSDNIYMYDMIVPSSSTWYSSFNEYSFKLSNLTYGNSTCSLNIDSINISTNDTIYSGDKTPFLYTTPVGPHNYSFSCVDVNESSSFNFSTTETLFGIKYSTGSSCTASEQCSGGYCVHSICRDTQTYCGDGYCDSGESQVTCFADCIAGGSSGGSVSIESGTETSTTETLPITIAFPSTIYNGANGPLIIPEGGAVISLPVDGEIITDSSGYPTSFVLLGASGYANITKTVEITPNEYKEVKCYQKPLASYVLEVSAKEKYLCLNTEEYASENVTDIKIYKFIDDEWTELPYKNYEGRICSPITSTPYMIAGFQTSATQQEAFTKIITAQNVVDEAYDSGKEVEYAKELLTEANAAYWNCQYANAAELATKAIQATSIIQVPMEITYAGVFIIFTSILYIFRKKIKFPNIKKKRK